MATQEWNWRPLAPPVERRMNSVFSTWLGTPYMPGQRARGLGVDCVQLVGGVLDDLFRNTQKTPIPRLGPARGSHTARAGFQTVIAIRKGFESVPVRNGVLEPGDVLVTRATLNPSAPRYFGHVMICGTHPYTALHAISGRGVTLTTLLIEVLRVYRPLHKESWA